MIPDICIYHGPGCMDGLVAAWAIWKRWPNIRFVPAQYGQAPPDVRDLNVLIVDFSYKRDVLVQMLAQPAKHIVVLDHHRTAEADLADFIDLTLRRPSDWLPRLGGYQISALFDMDKSGARLAWEYAHPGTDVPLLVRFVEDRDLWRFKMGATREVHAALAGGPETFDAADYMHDELENGSQTPYIAGASILNAQMKDMRAVITAGQQERQIAGYAVPVVNAPPMWASEIGNILAADRPFAATFYQTASGKWSFSLRSAPNGIDVSTIAASFGGGGHQHAAGFTADSLVWEVPWP